ncbi:MAG: hypothetical protein F2609_03905, partial [Actinobacteria bacterium]|nr:hypothetical protein [Actinomycetota bacterium]
MSKKTNKTSFVRAYGKVKQIESYRIVWLSKFVYSSPFELAISAVIVINAISLAVLTMPNLEPETIQLANTVDGIAFIIY